MEIITYITCIFDMYMCINIYIHIYCKKIETHMNKTAINFLLLTFEISY